MYKPNVTFWGHRGEKVEEGEWHVQIRKLHAAVGAENQYERIEEDEGLLHVPADCVVLADVTVVTKDTSRAAAAEAMGEEWNEMSRKNIGSSSYLLTCIYRSTSGSAFG